MTKDEALKLALEALECLKRDFDADQFEWGIADEAITAIEEALAQPEQEPVAYTNGTDVILAKYWTADYPPKGWEPLGYTTPPQRTWVGLDWLPEHKCGLYLSHNEHRDVYETIEEFYDAKDFISQEEWHKAVKEDSVWVLQWYPNTPIGFNRIAASTLQAIETKLKELTT